MTAKEQIVAIFAQMIDGGIADSEPGRTAPHDEMEAVISSVEQQERITP